MGLADRLRQLTKKATDTAAEHKDQVDQALHKAATAADQRSGGQYHDQIAKAESQAEAYVENLKAPTSADQPTQKAESTDETPGQPAG